MPLRPLKEGSIWYPIKLLAATGFAQSLRIGTTWLDAFHLGSFLLALVIHLFTSLLVGLLYGAMLPMFRVGQFFWRCHRADSLDRNPPQHPGAHKSTARCTY